MLGHLKSHFFSYTLILLTLLAVGASYRRFLVTYDYIVYDEPICGEYADSCFIYCEDDECTEPIYYALMERKASDLMDFCDGVNDMECEASWWCEPGEDTCSITFCDPAVDDDLCETFTEADRPPEEANEEVNEIGES